VAEVVDQLRQKGSVNLAQWAGTPRERIKEMLVEVFVDGEDEVPRNESVAFSALDDDEPYPRASPAKASESPVETSDPLPLTEAQEITSSAAIGLIQAMADTGNGHFNIEPDGCCTINRDNPPEITHAYQVVSNVLKLRQLGPAIDDKSAWMLGSVVASLEEYFGEDFSVSQVCEMTEQSENTIYQKVNVYKRFKDKRYSLSYSHHQEAHMSKLFNGDKPRNAAAQELVLSKCESYGLNKNHVRDLCSIIKRMEDEQVVRNIRSKDQALALIDTYKENKVVYYVYDEGVWSEIKGLDGQVPQGKVVLDTKNKKAHVNGQTLDIVKPS
jgi:hypothetical protein